MRVIHCLLIGSSVLAGGGCIDMWAAYGNSPTPDRPAPDPDDPRSLARSLMVNPESVAYTDDGERFAVHRCKRFKDDRLACDLAFGRRESGIDDIWPIAVQSRDFDRGGRRAVRDLLADYLDDLDAHAVLATAPAGRRVMVDGGHGRKRFVVGLDGTHLQLSFSETASVEDARPLAAVTLERGNLQPEIRAVASRHRRDMVAVELWVDVDEPAVAAYNASVLFFQNPDGRWLSRFIRPLRHDVLYSRVAEVRAGQAQTQPVAPKPAAAPEPQSPEGPLQVVPGDPALPIEDARRCETDADCARGRLCCSDGIGVRRCLEETGGCPKRP